MLLGVGDDVSSALTHYVNDVKRTVGLTGDHDSAVSSFRLYLVHIAT